MQFYFKEILTYYVQTVARLVVLRAPFQYPIRRLAVKSREVSKPIGNLDYRIAMKFDRHIGSNAAEVPVKFQSDQTIINANLAASRLCEILR